MAERVKIGSVWKYETAHPHVRYRVINHGDNLAVCLERCDRGATREGRRTWTNEWWPKNRLVRADG